MHYESVVAIVPAKYLLLDFLEYGMQLRFFSALLARTRSARSAPLRSPSSGVWGRRRCRALRHCLVAVLVSAGALVPLGGTALAEDSSDYDAVEYEDRTEATRLGPGATETIFFRANDVVTYRYCDDDTGNCVEQPATCTVAVENWRTMQEAAEDAWLVLALQGHWKLRGQRPFTTADLLSLLKPVLPLKYYYLNPSIEFADPTDPEGVFGDRSTFRDPEITDLIQGVFQRQNDGLWDVPDPLEVAHLHSPRSDTAEGPQTIFEVLPPDIRATLDSWPPGVPVPGSYLARIREALRVEPSDAVEATLSYINANIVNYGWPAPHRHHTYSRLEEMPHTLAFFRGDLLHGLLELLGLSDFSLRHIGSMWVPDDNGYPVKEIPGEWTVAQMAEACGSQRILNSSSIQFAPHPDDYSGDPVLSSEIVDVSRVFGSVRPVNGESSEKAHHVLGGTLFLDSNPRIYPLIQDADHNFYKGPWRHWWDRFKFRDVVSELDYYLNSSHLLLEYDQAVDEYKILLRGSDVVLRTVLPADWGNDPIEMVDPNVMSPQYEKSNSRSTEASPGGALDVTGKVIGEETVRYCVGSVATKRCDRWVEHQVVVEPAGWDDARIFGVDDRYRLLVNLDSLKISLLRESHDGDVTLDGTSYEVVSALCCLSAGDEHWSVNLRLDVMDNDRVAFFGGGHPLNRSGTQVLLADLVDDDTILCQGSRFCTEMRPRHVGAVSPGDFGLEAGPRYTSLEVTVSAPTGNTAVTSEQRTFDYCIAHREETCGGTPPTCAKATYLESPRAPNAPAGFPFESTAQLPSQHFVATTLCDGTTGTVTLSIDVYGVASPPDVPDEVWEDSPGGGGGTTRRIQCYARDLEGWAPKWRLSPHIERFREAPSWCHLPARSAVMGWDGDWHCQRTYPDTFSTGKVRPATSASWTSALHIAEFGTDGWERSGDDPLFLVGHGYTVPDGEMCRDSTAQIVGVWPTHVGADNWILRGSDSDRICTEADGYDQYAEASCLASQGALWEVSPTEGLGEAWHARLAEVEPCVGEVECASWVPSVPGWYQVRVELRAPRTELVATGPAGGLVEGTWLWNCTQAFWHIKLGRQPSISWQGSLVDAKNQGGIPWLKTCIVRWDSFDANFNPIRKREKPYSRGTTFVFDELIWVEEAHFGRG